MRQIERRFEKSMRLADVIRQLINESTLLGGFYIETREISLSTRTDPQGYASRGVPKLKIIYDQTRLAGTMHKKAGVSAPDRDPDVGPDSGFEIDIALVLFRGFSAGCSKVKIRVRAILRRVIAPDLVIGSTVRRTQVDVLKLTVFNVGHARHEWYREYVRARFKRSV